MLVLSRKVGERVRIAGDIVVQVLDVKGQRVRLGIEAPLEVAVGRGELAASKGLPPAIQKPVRKPR
jgi:carbon storage regulator